jgi:hypothetical protein
MGIKTRVISRWDWENPRREASIQAINRSAEPPLNLGKQLWADFVGAVTLRTE